jgi:outer membrane protein OmpA-like peptidoglycan-associated protein
VSGIIQADPSQNGCPPDADRDGFVDAIDACPTLAGVDYADAKLRGCPRAQLQPGAIQLNEPVRFVASSARLSKESDALLDTIADLLLKHTEVDHVVVEGHTDKSGSARANLELSRARAAAVVKWLVAHGVSARRLSSRGFGSSQPIAPNDTPDGRARNRRVEFRVLGPKDEPLVAPER